MTAITLESIQAEQARMNSLIDTYVRQQTTTIYGIPKAMIELAPGERYAGVILNDDGEPSHYLILLPGAAYNHNWEDAMAWAKGVGGELPTRRQQSLLYANLKSAFAPAAYWSTETHAEDSSCAWYQTFTDGGQLCLHKLSQLRAVAVRRWSLSNSVI